MSESLLVMYRLYFGFGYDICRIGRTSRVVAQEHKHAFRDPNRCRFHPRHNVYFDRQQYCNWIYIGRELYDS